MREAPLDALSEGDGLGLLGFSDEGALEPMAERFLGDEPWGVLCEACQDALREVDEIEIRALWDALPALFALGFEPGVWPSGGAAGTGSSGR